jgi:hypothetical protein
MERKPNLLIVSAFVSMVLVIVLLVASLDYLTGVFVCQQEGLARGIDTTFSLVTRCIGYVDGRWIAVP